MFGKRDPKTVFQCAVLSFLLIACGNSKSNNSQPDTASEISDSSSTQAGDTQTQSTDDSETETMVDSSTNGTDSGQPGESRPAIFERFGNLSTIAGTCTIEDKSTNGWDTAYEGGLAIDAELSRPHFAMADDGGNIFIADKDAHAIRKVTPEGTIHTVAGTGVAGNGQDDVGAGAEIELHSPNGLWVLADGTVFILDMGNDKVRKLTPDGQMVTLFTDTTAAGINLGRSVWMNDQETLCYYSSGTSVKRWTPEQGVSVVADGFSSLGALVVDPDGFVVATERGGHRVVRIAEDGTKTVIAGTGSAVISGGPGYLALETSLEEVRGVWFLEDGSYFLATHEGSQVWYVDINGVIHLFIDGTSNDVHAGDGEAFDTPGPKVSEVRGISCDAHGNLIITENDCGYIRRVEYKGN